jgi:nitrite reductase (NADH) small subunit
MATRVKLANRSDLPAGIGRIVAVEGRVLALFDVDGQVYAVANTCPHRGGPLGEGVLRGTVVTCPWHGWQFDVCTGRSPLNPTVSVRSIPLEIRGDEIYALLD